MEENKELFAEDLMVYDLVLLKESNSDQPALNHRLTFKDFIRIENGNLEAFAIPLTDEILEKNGFTKTDNWGKVFKIKEGLELVFAGMFSMHSYEFCGTDESVSACTGIYIDYVHELQHVLKQCEIEKNIIL